MVVNLTGRADQTRLLRVLRHDKPRVDGDTVAADARTRLQDIHPRMTVRQADQLPDVNALVSANQRQLVGKSDVDVAEAVFRQLAHLGGARVGHHAFAFKEDFIQLAGASGADRRHAADNAVVFNQLDHHLTGQYPLRAVGDIHVRRFTHLLGEAKIRAHLRQPLGHLFGRPDRRSGLEDHQRAFL